MVPNSGRFDFVWKFKGAKFWFARSNQSHMTAPTPTPTQPLTLRVKPLSPHPYTTNGKIILLFVGIKNVTISERHVHKMLQYFVTVPLWRHRLSVKRIHVYLSHQCKVYYYNKIISIFFFFPWLLSLNVTSKKEIGGLALNVSLKESRIVLSFHRFID